jgi:hypothetical protein
MTYPIPTDSFYALAGVERAVENAVKTSLHNAYAPERAEKMALVLFHIREAISTLGDDAEWT